VNPYLCDHSSFPPPVPFSVLPDLLPSVRFPVFYVISQGLVAPGTSGLVYLKASLGPLKVSPRVPPRSFLVPPPFFTAARAPLCGRSSGRFLFPPLPPSPSPTSFFYPLFKPFPPPPFFSLVISARFSCSNHCSGITRDHRSAPALSFPLLKRFMVLSFFFLSYR